MICLLIWILYIPLLFLVSWTSYPVTFLSFLHSSKNDVRSARQADALHVAHGCACREFYDTTTHSPCSISKGSCWLRNSHVYEYDHERLATSIGAFSGLVVRFLCRRQKLEWRRREVALGCGHRKKAGWRPQVEAWEKVMAAKKKRLDWLVALAEAGDRFVTKKECAIEQQWSISSGYVQIASKKVFGSAKNSGIARSSCLSSCRRITSLQQENSCSQKWNPRRKMTTARE